MGGNTWQLIWHTLLPESRAGLIAAVTVTAILLVDYTSMAGVIGGGGLGDLAIRWLSALPDGRHGDYRSAADCAGADSTNERRSSGEGDEPQITIASGIRQ